MRDGKRSATALRVAIRRAAHQRMDMPVVFDDPLAVAIAGAADEIGPSSLRAFLAVRSRFAEDELARAVGRGATQYVVLGAGLDTFAYRNPFGAQLRVFEVDFPATQAWKKDRLRQAGIPEPPSLVFAPVDFQRESLEDGLRGSGFNFGAITFFSWLGVTPYLTRDAVFGTLRFIGTMPERTGVAFDYAMPRERLNLLNRLAFDALAARVAKAGEPFQTFFDPAELQHQMEAMGFRHFEDLGAEDINARYFPNRADGLCVKASLGRLLSALR